MMMDMDVMMQLDANEITDAINAAAGAVEAQKEAITVIVEKKKSIIESRRQSEKS